MKTKRKIPISLAAALVLLCLVLVSAHFTTGMYARYASNSERSAGASAAKLQVLVEEAGNSSGASTSSSVSLTAGEAAQYTIKIRNPGQTAVKYTTQVVFEEESASLFKQPDSLTGTLAPGENREETISLELKDPEAGNGLDFDNDVLANENGEIPFEVLVTFVQID